MAAKSNLATKDEALVIERTLDASVELVWRALTDVDNIKHWSFDIREFEPRVGFEFQFYGGDGKTRYLHRCKVTEAVAGKRLAYTWRYEGYAGDSLVTFELSAEGKRTRVTPALLKGMEAANYSGYLNLKPILNRFLSIGLNWQCSKVAAKRKGVID